MQYPRRFTGQALRTFTLTRITAIDKSPDHKPAPAKQIPKQQLEEYFASSCGLFAGKPKQVAKLRFLPEVAREIALQQWHPNQQGEWEKGEYLLSIPYSDDHELIQDILRYCPNVVVEAPVALRKKLLTRLQDALGRLAGG